MWKLLNIIVFNSKSFSFVGEVAKDSSKVKSARKFNIHIVTQKLIEDVKSGMAPVNAVKENLICDWGGDVSCLWTFGIIFNMSKNNLIGTDCHSFYVCSIL